MEGIVVVLVLGLFLVTIGFLITLSRFYRRVEQGKALIVSRWRKPDPDVTFTGCVVWPIFNKAEVMDISVKTMEIDRRGKEGLICQDNIRADIKVTFFVRVNKTREDAIKVAQAIGCARASDQRTLEELFSAKFSEALKTVGKQLDFIDLYTKREEFRDQILRVIGRDLNGYVLEDAAIDFLEQTPVSTLDPTNILDAQGIRKITELTAAEHVRTNDFQNSEKKQIKKQDVEAAETIYELERRQAEALAVQKREIESVQAREGAESLKIQAEEKQKSEQARIASEQQVGVADHNRWREVEVAERNRQRVVAIETQKVERDTQLEIIAREREVELQRIEKEKQIEVQKKAIADVVRERVAVEKTVAEEEEKIKGVRVVEEAKRTRDALVIGAEAEAQEGFVKATKQAEAQQEMAKFKAQERIVLADASLEAADREAKAAIRRADGAQAEAAAGGLAAAKVKEADAVATEKYGLAQARVKEADAEASEKVGLVQAKVTRETGDADAFATEKKALAEATGIQKKAEAMKVLDGSGRAHEEFKIGIRTRKDVQLAAIEAQKLVADRQASVLSSALQNAKIDIIGAEPILDRVVSGVGLAKGLDAGVSRSDAARALLGDYIDGSASFPDDLKTILQGLGSEGVKNLSLSALLARLATGAGDADRKKKLEKLAENAKNLGLDDLSIG